jgi:hypothetical protein
MSELETAQDLYLSLLSECLIGSLIEDSINRPYDKQRRDSGLDWPLWGISMIGRRRMAHLRKSMECVLREGIPGDVMETGVWRGGACIFMRAVLKVHGISDRRVWLADSFEGLPPPDAASFPADVDSTLHTYDQLRVSIEDVQRNFTRYGLLDDQVRFLKGWFRDTLPTAPVTRLALLRLDGDMYESTIVTLESLYDRVSPGGFVIIDDYHGVEACRMAVHDFCDKRGFLPGIEEIDGMGVYWRAR